MIGEAAHPEVIDGIEAMVTAQPGILSLNELLTMHLGPKDILLNLRVDFDDRCSPAEVEAAITGLKADIKARYPEIMRVFIEAQSWRAHLDSQQQAAVEADPGHKKG